jgi:hypothetical protein
VASVAAARLQAQSLVRPAATTPDALVGAMCALQAQDRAMAKWAIGVRVPGATDAYVEAAVSRAAIVRTHALRPTYHFVAGRDLRWLMRLSTPRIRAAIAPNDRRLGLTERDFTRSLGVIERKLARGGRATREELRVALLRARVNLDGNRLYHILVRAEIEELLFGDSPDDGQPVYAALDGRIPQLAGFIREEACARLARAYFGTRGPAALKDFSWWSGLGLAEAREAVGACGPELAQVKGTELWRLPGAEAARLSSGVMLLPAFDEVLISYADRSAFLTDRAARAAVSSNGVFRPIVLSAGKVIGTWTRSTGPRTVAVEARLFARPGGAARRGIEQAAARFAAFVDRELELSITVVRGRPTSASAPPTAR